MAESVGQRFMLGTVVGYGLGAVTWATAVTVCLGLADREPLHGWLMLAAEVLTRTNYGYQFALITLHLWGSIGAIIGYLLASKKPLQFRLMHIILFVLTLALSLSSVRWLYTEIRGAQLGTQQPVGPFQQSASIGMVAIAAVVALIMTVWYKVRAKRRTG